jgi:methionyl aminopeptidase
MPGVISPMRYVPDHIAKPPYATTGNVPNTRESAVKTPEVIERMRVAGKAAAEILTKAGELVRPGITTEEIDIFVHDLTIQMGGYPSPLNYHGYPKSVCTSVNEVICHGIPDNRMLEDGDIVNIDVTIFLNGVHGDTNATFAVGNISDDDKKLMRVTEECLWKAIEVVKPGMLMNEIGRAIQMHAHDSNFGVVRMFTGHGIGETFHTEPQVLHYFDKFDSTIIREGMTFTIEPMITASGETGHKTWKDQWTAVTADYSRTAQYEHTMVVTADGVEVLTAGPGAVSPSAPWNR